MEALPVPLVFAEVVQFCREVFHGAPVAMAWIMLPSQSRLMSISEVASPACDPDLMRTAAFLTTTA